MQTNVIDRTYEETEADQKGLVDFINQYRPFEMFATLTSPSENKDVIKFDKRLKEWIRSVAIASSVQLCAIGVIPTHKDSLHAHLLIRGKSKKYNSLLEAFNAYFMDADGISLKALKLDKIDNKVTKFMGQFWRGETDFQFIIPTKEDRERVIEYITGDHNVTGYGWDKFTYNNSFLKKLKRSA
jgi:hypothetical protein